MAGRSGASHGGARPYCSTLALNSSSRPWPAARTGSLAGVQALKHFGPPLAWLGVDACGRGATRSHTPAPRGGSQSPVEPEVEASAVRLSVARDSPAGRPARLVILASEPGWLSSADFLQARTPLVGEAEDRLLEGDSARSSSPRLPQARHPSAWSCRSAAAKRCSA